jgi:hypothetical protein
MGNRRYHCEHHLYLHFNYSAEQGLGRIGGVFVVRRRLWTHGHSVHHVGCLLDLNLVSMVGFLGSEL